MAEEDDNITIKVIRDIWQIEPEQWDACAGGRNPTVSHAFLSSMEDSGSVCADTGWQPQHLVIADATGQVNAVAPLYLKNHSYGEYVFDWGWADAYQRAGGQYYPKLQSSAPFTPVSGPRLLVRPEADPNLADALLSGMANLCGQLGASSVHVTFLEEDEWHRADKHGYLRRTGEQFHWQNEGYETFDDFLAALSSRKRKNIKKERKVAQEYGFDIRALSGDELTEPLWDAFYQFYLDTTDKKWGQSYLNREFFSKMSERMADRIVLIMAFDGDTPVAGALNILGEDSLYGRNWGCLSEYRYLHFECCYYQAIDYAIKHGLKRVEAGAQGQHKLQRGYMPSRTYSAHWIANPSFRDAIENYLDSEREHIEDEIKILSEHSPYRQAE